MVPSFAGTSRETELFVIRTAEAQQLNDGSLSGHLSDTLNIYPVERYLINANDSFGHIAALEFLVLSVGFGSILLKNSIIWMRDFSGENQTTLNLTYK